MERDLNSSTTADAGQEARDLPRFIRARYLHTSQDEMIPEPAMHPSDAAGAAAMTRSSPLATLLAGHVLRDGETVLLVLKPSLWFIAFQSMLFAAAVLLVLLVTRGFGDRLGSVQRLAYIEAGVFVLGGRLMWAVLQWMGRLYVLTDQRIIRLSGVFTIDLYDCPLRKIARTQMTASVKERICRLGSIEFYPKGLDESRDDSPRIGAWQIIPRPAEVHEQIVAAIRRVQNGNG